MLTNPLETADLVTLTEEIIGNFIFCAVWRHFGVFIVNFQHIWQRF